MEYRYFSPVDRRKFPQDFSRKHIRYSLRFTLLTLLDDFDVVRGAIFPCETESPVIIYPNTVLPSPIVAQFFNRSRGGIPGSLIVAALLSIRSYRRVVLWMSVGSRLVWRTQQLSSVGCDGNDLITCNSNTSVSRFASFSAVCATCSSSGSPAFWRSLTKAITRRKWRTSDVCPVVFVQHPRTEAGWPLRDHKLQSPLSWVVYPIARSAIYLLAVC